MSMLRRIKQDKELMKMIEMCWDKLGYNPVPYHFETYASFDAYKERVKEFVEKEFGEKAL